MYISLVFINFELNYSCFLMVIFFFSTSHLVTQLHHLCFKLDVFQWTSGNLFTCHLSVPHYFSIQWNFNNVRAVFFRGNWQTSGRDLHGPQFIAMVSTDRNFLNPEYEEYSASTRNSNCCRSVAIAVNLSLSLPSCLSVLKTLTWDRPWFIQMKLVVLLVNNVWFRSARNILIVDCEFCSLWFFWFYGILFQSSLGPMKFPSHCLWWGNIFPEDIDEIHKYKCIYLSLFALSDSCYFYELLGFFFQYMLSWEQ